MTQLRTWIHDGSKYIAESFLARSEAHEFKESLEIGVFTASVALAVSVVAQAIFSVFGSALLFSGIGLYVGYEAAHNICALNVEGDSAAKPIVRFANRYIVALDQAYNKLSTLWSNS